MKIKSILNSILILVLSGCIIIPKKNADTMAVSPTFDKATCFARSAKVIFRQILKSDYTSERYVDPNEKHGNIVFASKHIYDTINKYGFLNLNNTREDFDLFIEFTVYEQDYSNFLQQSNFWLSSLTLGLLPAWGSGNMYITSTFRDKDGNILDEVTSQKQEYNYLRGLIFFPFNFNRRTTPAFMHEEFIPKMTIDIFNQVEKKQLLCKKK